MNEHYIANLSDAAKNAIINTICLPGTHDSAAYGHINSQIKLEGEEILGIAARLATPLTGFIGYWLINRMTITQGTNIYQQLMNGIRFFDIRIAYSSEYRTFYVLHGVAILPLSIILNDFLRFAKSHPDEVIFIEYVLYNSTLTDDQRRTDALNYVSKFLSSVLYTRLDTDVSIIDKNPMLSKSINEILSTGKNVIVCHDSDWNIRDYPDIQLHKLVNYYTETDNPTVKFNHLETELNNYNVSSNNTFKLEWTLTSIFPSFLIQIPDLKDMSRIIYQYLPKFLQDVGRENRDKISIIAVDYQENTDVVEQCKLLNIERYG